MTDACPCGKPITKVRRYCCGCYRRWLGAGKPESGPPAPYSGVWGRVMDDRLADYVEVRAQGGGPEAAAYRLRVTVRTIYRYEARLRAREDA